MFTFTDIQFLFEQYNNVKKKSLIDNFITNKIKLYPKKLLHRNNISIERNYEMFEIEHKYGTISNMIQYYHENSTLTT